MFIAISGKHLRVNFALDPNDYANSTIPVTANKSSKFSDIPTTLKVRSDLSLKRAKMLVDDVMAKKGIEKGETPLEEPYIPGESPAEEAPVAEPIEEKASIEEIPVEVAPVPKVIVEEPVEEAQEEPAPTEEALVEEEPAPEEDQPEEAAEESESGETPAASAIPNTGKSNVSFEEKLADLDDDVKSKYDELCQYIEQFGIKQRISKPGCTYSAHRERYVFIAISGKHLRVNFALDPNDYANSTIPVTANKSNKFSDIPTTLKVRSDLSFKRAKMLVDDVMAKKGVEKGSAPSED